jgi:hypothetical protein
LSKALQARGSAARLRAIEADLGDFSLKRKLFTGRIKDCLSGVFDGVVRVFQPISPRFSASNLKKLSAALPKSAPRFWRRLEMAEQVSGVMKDKWPSRWKRDGSLEFGHIVPF